MSKIVVDGNSLLYRGYYATINQKMRNSIGLNTGGIVAFFNTLNKLMYQFETKDFIFVFDAPSSGTKNREKNSNYKMNRREKPKDENLYQQLNIAKELLRFNGEIIYEAPNVEADDVAGQLAKNISEKEQVYVITGDSDFFQLIEHPNIQILYKIMKGEEMYDEDKFLEKYGFPSKYYVAYKSLVGDKTDNVDGVKGYGKVKVSKLIEKYGDLDNIIENDPYLKGIEQEVRNYQSQIRFDELSGNFLENHRKSFPKDFEKLEMKFDYLEMERTRNLDFFSREELNIEDLKSKNLEKVKTPKKKKNEPSKDQMALF